MVQWLGLGAFTARSQVQSLVGELRSCKPRGAAIKKKKIVVEETKISTVQVLQIIKSYCYTLLSMT